MIIIVHQPQRTSPITLDRVKFHVVFVLPTRLYCTNRLPELTLPIVLSVVLLLQATVWNSLSNNNNNNNIHICIAPYGRNFRGADNDIVSSTSLAVFKSTLKTFLFRQTFRPSWLSRP